MDQELATYLDRKSAEQEATTRRIVDQATQGLATKEQLEEHKLDTKEQFEEHKLDTKKQLDDQFRRTQVLIEDLRGDVQQIAEGVVEINAKFDRQWEENEAARREDRAFFTSLFREVNGQVGNHETRITRLESARA